MTRTALVTGATAGIGAAFARQLAAEGYELVLAARGEERLTALAAELTVPVEVLVADLATAEGCDAVAARLTDPARPVEMLVNNAGRSLNRSFLHSSVELEEELLRLNVHAVMRLTLAALPGMVERGRGDVVNVSSASGFAALMPGSTYPAGKAWVTNFSESQAQLVRPMGVRVMALCPGYTRTEFHERAGIDMSKTPAWMWLDAGAVVRAGLKDLRRGRMVSVPDWKYKLAVFGMRHAPRGLVHRVSQDTRGRIGHQER
ncbi:SDR family NAD(P)-dependent oxidoreductase [Dactylosporangium sp. CA-233914]|uniref:SDR family NAD(P)-dependent oxidoreductase n=1 Tax=Dactylosporangium sp. CA-233914 TaxID=3239934 RepID=UPI003D8C26F7